MTIKVAIRRSIKWAMFWQAWLAVWIIMQIVAAFGRQSLHKNRLPLSSQPISLGEQSEQL